MAIIKDNLYNIDINTLERQEGNDALKMNEIAKVKISVARPIMVDSYRKNRNIWSIILIDSNTNETIAAGMITWVFFRPFYF